MTAQQATAALSRPLAIGDREQIKANKFFCRVQEIVNSISLDEDEMPPFGADEWLETVAKKFTRDDEEVVKHAARVLGLGKLKSDVASFPETTP